VTYLVVPTKDIMSITVKFNGEITLTPIDETLIKYFDVITSICLFMVTSHTYPLDPDTIETYACEAFSEYSDFDPVLGDYDTIKKLLWIVPEVYDRMHSSIMLYKQHHDIDFKVHENFIDFYSFTGYDVVLKITR